MGWKDVAKNTAKNIALDTADAFLDSYERCSRQRGEEAETDALRDAIGNARKSGRNNDDEQW